MSICLWLNVNKRHRTGFLHSSERENPPADVAESFWILYNLERNQHFHSPYGYGLLLYNFW